MSLRSLHSAPLLRNRHSPLQRSCHRAELPLPLRSEGSLAEWPTGPHDTGYEPASLPWGNVVHIFEDPTLDVPVLRMIEEFGPQAPRWAVGDVPAPQTRDEVAKGPAVVSF